jgi:phage gpG-like protein
MGFTRVFNGLGEFGRFLGKTAALSVAAQEAGTALQSEVLYKRVRSIFGDSSKLAPISQDSTGQLRSDGGAGGPLYIDGELLKDKTEKEHGLNFAGVGSAEPLQLVHEVGFVTSPLSMIPNKQVPGRPVYEIALKESQADLAAIVDDVVAVTLGARSALRLATTLEDGE